MDVLRYAETAIPHLEKSLEKNHPVLKRVAEKLVEAVRDGNSLFVFGSGHSSLFALELYHRAGGASFVIPIVAEYLMPQAGPTVVRTLERMEKTALPAFHRVKPRKGDMLWLASQSGINPAVLDIALEAKQAGLSTVAFTSVEHSSSVPSRHSSGKRLYEVCDEAVDLGGFVGDAAVSITDELRAGPLSTLTSVFLGHSILVAACEELEKSGKRCVYTSVNTPSGEKRNRELEASASKRDWLLR